MGKTGLYLKISFLAIILVIVVMAIRGMTTEKVQGAFQALGIEPGAEGQPGLQAGGTALADGETRRTLCQTRVHAIRFPDGRSIVEQKNGMKLDWTAEEDPASAETLGNSGTETSEGGTAPESAKTRGVRSVGYLEIEKWFSKHCQFVASAAPAVSSETLEPSNEPVKFVRIEFIDKSQWELYRSGDVLFSGSDPKDRFVSPDLQRALEELRAIAGFPVDMKDR